MSRLSKRTCDAAIAASGTSDRLIWDTEMPGFGLRIKSGSRTFLIQYRNAHGRSRRLSLGRYGVLTAEEARKEARRLLAEVAAGIDVAERRKSDRTAMTVTELCDQYLLEVERGNVLTRFGAPKKTSTVATDRGRIERHIRPLLGHRVVADLLPTDIERFRRDVREGKTAVDVKTGKRGRAIVKGGAGTATRTLGLLSGIMAFAKSEGYRQDNPVHGVKRDASRKRKIALSCQQYASLGAALAACGMVWQAKAAIILTALTGARRSEIEKLPVIDVHLEGHCLALSDSKTGPSIRPIGAPVIDILEALAPFAEGGYVLPSIRKAAASHYGGLPGAWNVVRKAVPSLAGVTLRDLRRSFSTVADELGLTIPTIGGMIGHAGSTITEGYIVKADPALIVAADLVATEIFKRLGIDLGSVLPPMATPTRRHKSPVDRRRASKREQRHSSPAPVETVRTRRV